MDQVDVGELTRVAECRVGAALSFRMHQSLPIPLLQEGVLRVAFLYAPAEVREPGQGLSLEAPRFIARFTVHSGDFEELIPVSAAELGIDASDTDAIGTYLTTSERVTPEFLTKLLRLYQAYDRLLPAFAEAERDDVTVSPVAREFIELFFAVSERPLHPYYREIGRQFFTWVSSLNY